MDSLVVTLWRGATQIPCHPVYGDGMKFKYSKEQDQVFPRTQIDSTIKFVREDFDLIASLSNEITLTIKVHRGGLLLGSFSFIKADCEMDYDNRTCSIKISTKDKYETILSKYDAKYNLVSLAPPVKEVQMRKRPVVQFYAFGDRKITNLVGNTTFEVDAISAEEKTRAQIEALGFNPVLHTISAVVDIRTQFLPSEDVNGVYRGVAVEGSDTALLYHENGLYVIAYYTSNWWVIYYNVPSLDPVKNPNSNGFFRFEYDSTSFSGQPIRIYDNNLGQYVGYITFQNRIIYSRILSDKATKPVSWPTDPIAYDTLSDDIYSNTDNYQYVYEVGDYLDSYAHYKNEFTATPNEYPYKDNQYYVPYPVASEHIAFPIGQSMWDTYSFWFDSSTTISSDLDSKFAEFFTLKDAYRLFDAIPILLAKIDPDVVCAPSLDVFFMQSATYPPAIYPNTAGSFAPPWTRNSDIYITPITNVKKTRYEQAAQRGDITLKQIFDMLRQFYGCYWYIDEGMHLRIEHISYFKHNQTYEVGMATPDLDTTTMKDMPNGLSWGYNTNKSSVDRKKLPCRYEFAWADECSVPFNGVPIDISSKEVGANVEKVQVDNFVSDIDFIIANPSGVSDDVYVLMEAADAYGTIPRRVAINNVYIDGVSYRMQNCYCSFSFAESVYLTHNLGGWKAKTGDTTLGVEGVVAATNQSVSFPMDINLIGDIIAVKTGLGVGLLTESEIGADTLHCKGKVAFEQEKDYSGSITASDFSPSPSTHVYKITNSYSEPLLVKMLYEGEVKTLLVQNNSFEITDLDSDNDLVILSARIGGNFHLYEEQMDANGYMVFGVVRGESSLVITISGNWTAVTSDWAYICLVPLVDCSLRMACSMAENHYGYIGKKAFAEKGPDPEDGISDFDANTYAYRSGTDVAEMALSAGVPYYLGFVKNDDLPDNDDEVIFTINL